MEVVDLGVIKCFRERILRLFHSPFSPLLPPSSLPSSSALLSPSTSPSLFLCSASPLSLSLALLLVYFIALDRLRLVSSISHPLFDRLSVHHHFLVLGRRSLRGKMVLAVDLEGLESVYAVGGCRGLSPVDTPIGKHGSNP
eukprot:760918-Hanusia_phi.AAC.5